AIRKMVTQLLTRLGYTVEAFENPTDALKRFKQQQDKFDLVLTDMTMPYMTGVELTQEIRKIKTTIAVIICTGHSDFIDQESVKAMSIDGFIIKPIRIADMAKVVRKVLDRKN
ncbi:MAG: response regulator, partial [Desulfocapsaceae bacterium]|nr:response regulator [Desulfocapsaceae bacterium]